MTTALFPVSSCFQDLSPPSQNSHFRHLSFGQLPPERIPISEPQTVRKRPKRRIKILNKNIPDFRPPQDDNCQYDRLFIPSRLGIGDDLRSSAPSLINNQEYNHASAKKLISISSSAVFETQSQNQNAVEMNTYADNRSSLASAQIGFRSKVNNLCSAKKKPLTIENRIPACFKVTNSQRSFGKRKINSNQV